MKPITCKPWPPKKPAALAFGINGHMTWGSNLGTSMYMAASDAATIATMVDLGMRVYRNGYQVTQDTTGKVTGDPSARFKQFIAAAAPAGIVVTPVLLPNNTVAAGVTNEATGYTFGFNLGVNVATNLSGLVPHYEIGNELEAVPGNQCIQSGSGNSNGNYDNTKFQIFRGIIFGMIDGIRSIDQTTPLAGGGGTFAHTAFYQMLRDGTQPDGKTGFRKMDWDITSWHWYVNSSSTNDDPENMQGFNVLAKVASWGKPIHITECGALWTGAAWAQSETGVAAAIVGNNCVGRFVSARKTYGIKSIVYYQLFDSATSPSNTTGDEMNFAVCDVNGAQKGRYATIKSFVAANLF